MQASVPVHRPSAARRAIAEATVARLPLYLRALGELSDSGATTISSEDLAVAAGVTSAKVRKDLSQLGSYGTRGVGYEVDCLSEEISRELGVTQHRAVAIVGVGNLGHALAGYAGFSARGFRVAGLFDEDASRCEEIVAGMAVQPMDQLEATVASEQVSIGVIATPACAAQQVCDRLVACGVTSVLNFAPTVLSVPAGVDVRKVDLALELQILSFHETRKSRAALTSPLAPLAPPPPGHVGQGLMSLLAIGLNHRSASPELLERTVVSPEDVPKVLHDLLAGEHLTEAVLLTTCNRVEVYAETATFHGGVTEVGEVLARTAGLPFEELHRSLYVHHEARAVQHLFSVACGLDSMLVGEAQILGQVRQAYKIAREESSAGRGLSELMREALRVGKRAHSETGIDTAAASLVGVGLRVAADALPFGAHSANPSANPTANPTANPLVGARVLLVGAGSTGALAGSLLRKAGVGQLVVANRSADRAERLATNLDGRAVTLAAVPAELREADLVVTATGATLPVLPAEMVEQALAARDGRGLVLLDLGLPRDVEPRVRELPGVSLIDLEGLRAALAGSDVVTDVDAVRALVTEEVSSYVDRQRALRVAPTVAALRARAAEMVATELDRLSGRLPNLSEKERSEVAITVRRVVDKLLHAPTVRVKELAESPGGDRYAEALHELFELDPRKAQAVSSPGLDELPRPMPGSSPGLSS